MGSAWLNLAARIDTVAILNEAMHTSRYDLNNIDDVPSDIIQLCISRKLGAPRGSSD